MIFVLDTDILTLLAYEAPAAAEVRQQIVQLPPADSVTTTIINYEEQMRGWMALLAKAKTPNTQIAAYARLLDHLTTFRRISVLGYSEASAARFDILRKQRLQIGTMDLRIASIVLAADGTLVTRNKKDFGKIANLRLADWLQGDGA